MRTEALRWSLGALGALLVVWAASAVLLDTVAPLVFEPEVTRHVRASGTVYQHRSEGWATTRVGRLGINGVPDAAQLKGPKIAIWGDSFMDALQVNDEDKTAQVLTRLLHEAGRPETAFAVAQGGLSPADYYFLMPAYEQAITEITAHVVVLGDSDDILPDKNAPCRSRFLSSPPRLEPGLCPPTPLALALTKTLYRSRTAFLFDLYSRLQSRDWRLLPRIRHLPAPVHSRPDEPAPHAWDFLLQALRKQAQGNLVIVYCPRVPRTDREGVRLDDPNGRIMAGFADACARNGVAFLNLTDALAREYERTATPSRGFFNTPPSSGHMNPSGHRVLARALYALFQEWTDAPVQP